MQQRRVEVRLFGRVLDEKYTRVLKTLPDLSLPDVMLLDAVQKGRPLSDEGTKTLRRKKLIEGRKPNLHVSERVADATGERVAYTRNRGLDKDYYKQLLLKHLDRFGSVTREEIDQLLRGKLADLLSEEQNPQPDRGNEGQGRHDHEPRHQEKAPLGASVRHFCLVKLS